MHAVILAAGRGKRLRPITDHLPKSLIPFWDRPFLTYLLENLEGVVDEVIIVQAPTGEVAAALGNRYGSLRLRYVTQAIPRGTGDAVLQVAGLLHEPFLLLLGDTCPPRTTLLELVEGPGDLALTVVEVDDPENHAGIGVDAEGRVRAIWTNSTAVDAGVFRFPTEIFAATAGEEPLRGELRVLQGVARLIEDGADARAVRLPHPWLQFGDHEGLAGVLRVMRALAESQGIEPSCDGSNVMVQTRACTITDSLVFGPGTLTACTIRNAMVYCGRHVEGVTISGEIAALT